MGVDAESPKQFLQPGAVLATLFAALLQPRGTHGALLWSTPGRPSNSRRQAQCPPPGCCWLQPGGVGVALHLGLRGVAQAILAARCSARHSVAVLLQPRGTHGALLGRRGVAGAILAARRSAGHIVCNIVSSIASAQGTQRPYCLVDACVARAILAARRSAHHALQPRFSFGLWSTPS